MSVLYAPPRFPARVGNARNPPNYVVHGRDPECPVNVDTSRLVRATEN
jgi:hypothetical protein